MSWGGSIFFKEAFEWYFDGDLNTKEAFPGYDFATVSTKEILRVLGFGMRNSWWDLRNSEGFAGPNAIGAYCGPVPLDIDGFWTDSVVSVSLVTDELQQALMSTTVDPGVRKDMTALDLAALQDLGFTASSILGPSNIAFLGGIAAFALISGRGQQRNRAGG